MSEADAKTPGNGLPCGVELKPGYADSLWRPGMDPNYSSHRGAYPSSDTATSCGSSSPAVQAGDLAPKQSLGREQAQQSPVDLWRQLQVMPLGQRIRNLRVLLGWTQRMAAEKLGISVRTVIRHERGRNRRSWMRLPPLLRLRELESDYAEELIAYLGRLRRGQV